MSINRQLTYFANLIKTAFGEIINATGGSAINSQNNYVDVITAGGAGLLVDVITLTSNDSAAANVVIARKRGGTYYPLVVVAVAANSGTNGTTAAVDPLGGSLWTGLAINDQGKRYVRLEVGDSLAIKTLVAVTNTAGMAIRCNVSGLEFEV